MRFLLASIVTDIIMQDLEHHALGYIGLYGIIRLELPIFCHYVDNILLVTPKEFVDEINSFNNYQYIEIYKI